MTVGVEGFRIGELTDLGAYGVCEEGDGEDGCRLAATSGESQAVSPSNEGSPPPGGEATSESWHQ